MSAQPKQMLLDPGFELTLRPMRYPQFYDMYRDAIRNTWTVEEINFQIDIADLHGKMTPADRHLGASSPEVPPGAASLAGSSVVPGHGSGEVAAGAPAGSGGNAG